MSELVQCPGHCAKTVSEARFSQTTPLILKPSPHLFYRTKPELSEVRFFQSHKITKFNSVLKIQHRSGLNALETDGLISPANFIRPVGVGGRLYFIRASLSWPKPPHVLPESAPALRRGLGSSELLSTHVSSVLALAHEGGLPWLYFTP